MKTNMRTILGVSLFSIALILSIGLFGNWSILSVTGDNCHDAIEFCSDSSGTFVDSCYNDITINEHYCDAVQDKCVVKQTACGIGNICSDGLCIKT